MTKEDIKVGMLVELRNKYVYIVVDVEGKRLLARDGKFLEFEYNDDLTFAHGELSHSVQFDIMKVYITKYPWRILSDMMEYGKITTCHCELIWNRDDKLKVGDSVEIIDTGLSYAKHVEFLEINFPEFLGRYAYGVLPRKSRTYRVIGSETNTNGDGNNILVIQYMSGQIFLIGEDGVKKVS